MQPRPARSAHPSGPTVAVRDASATVAGSRVFTCPGEPMTSTTPIDRTDWDDAVRPADDFYRHVNGRWLAPTRSRPSTARYGRVPRGQRAQPGAPPPAAPRGGRRPGAEGSVRHMVGDYFAAGMDEAAIDGGRGRAHPAAARRDRRARVRRRRPRARRRSSSATASARSTRIGSPPTSRTRTPTSCTSARAGSGSPSATTTSATTSAPSRCATRTCAHVAAQLGNLDDGRRGGSRRADGILAFERRLAEASLTKEQQRDPQLTLNRPHVDDLDALMPAAGASPTLVRERRRHAAHGERRQPRRSSAALDAAIAETPDRRPSATTSAGTS